MYNHTHASWKACQLFLCLALSSRHARWHDLAVAEYPRPPSEAYLPDRDVPLKTCQTKVKKPLDVLTALQKMLYLTGETSVTEPSSSDTLSREHWENKPAQNSPHHENLPKCEALGSPNTIKHGKNSTWESSTSNTIAWQGRRNNRPHTERRFIRTRVWLRNGKHLLRRCGCARDR